ncbi:MAG: hypothetical protein ACRDD7_13550, partial [Peptostreptococcaceae bacterium]
MKKIIAGLTIASIIGGGVLIGLKTITASAQEENINNIEKDLKSIIDGKDVVNWESIMDKKYGDNWEDKLDKKHGEDWDDQFEQEVIKLYPNETIDKDDVDDKDDKYDDDKDDVDDKDDKYDDD